MMGNGLFSPTEIPALAWRGRFPSKAHQVLGFFRTEELTIAECLLLGRTFRCSELLTDSPTRVSPLLVEAVSNLSSL